MQAWAAGDRGCSNRGRPRGDACSFLGLPTPKAKICTSGQPRGWGWEGKRVFRPTREDPGFPLFLELGLGQGSLAGAGCRGLPPGETVQGPLGLGRCSWAGASPRTCIARFVPALCAYSWPHHRGGGSHWVALSRTPTQARTVFTETRAGREGELGTAAPHPNSQQLTGRANPSISGKGHSPGVHLAFSWPMEVTHFSGVPGGRVGRARGARVAAQTACL